MAEIDRRHIFQQYFETPSGYEFAKNQAFAGTLQHSPLRTLCWRVFLGLIPQNDTQNWLSVIQSQRTEYTELLHRYFPPEKAEDSNNNNNHNNNSNDVNNDKREEQMQAITLDVRRCRSDHPFFQSPITRDRMIRILYIYTQSHVRSFHENDQTESDVVVDYRSGMMEILAPIIYLFHTQSIPSDQLEGHISSIANSDEYIEHDSFVVFRKVMETCERWYFTNHHLAPSSDIMEDKDLSAVIRKCNEIQFKVLCEADPALFTFFDELCIEPQLYLWRWVKLMFAAEYQLEKVLVLWDAIFAFGNQFILMDYIATSMLIVIRDGLMKEDFNGCLKILFHFNKFEDERVVLSKAIALASKSFALPIPIPSPNKANPKPSPSRPPARSDSSPLGMMSDKYKKSEDTRKHMASRLERIIYILQTSVLNGSEMDKDSLIGAIAELKQIKDVLNGSIEYLNSSLSPDDLLSSFHRNNS